MGVLRSVCWLLLHCKSEGLAESVSRPHSLSTLQRPFFLLLFSFSFLLFHQSQFFWIVLNLWICFSLGSYFSLLIFCLINLRGTRAAVETMVFDDIYFIWNLFFLLIHLKCTGDKRKKEIVLIILPRMLPTIIPETAQFSSVGIRM